FASSLIKSLLVAARLDYVITSTRERAPFFTRSSVLSKRPEYYSIRRTFAANVVAMQFFLGARAGRKLYRGKRRRNASGSQKTRRRLRQHPHGNSSEAGNDGMGHAYGS